MSVGLRAPVPQCELNLIGEGRGKCEHSVIKGYNCKLKEERHTFKNSEDVVLQLYSISSLTSDSK